MLILPACGLLTRSGAAADIQVTASHIHPHTAFVFLKPVQPGRIACSRRIFHVKQAKSDASCCE